MPFVSLLIGFEIEHFYIFKDKGIMCQSSIIIFGFYNIPLFQALDGNVYDHLKDYLIAFSRTELETCQAIQNTFQFLLENSSKVMCL